MEPQLPKALHELEEDLGRLAHKKEGTSQVLSSSVQNLQGSIDELILMFKRANEELTLEQREEQLIKSQLDPVNKKLQELSEQQETIASAIVSVSDAIDGLVNSVNEIKARMSGMDLTSNAARMPTQMQSAFPPQQFQPQSASLASRPNYQRFEFANSSNAQNNPNQGVGQLPPLPSPPTNQINQSIPSIEPNEFGDKKKFF